MLHFLQTSCLPNTPLDRRTIEHTPTGTERFVRNLECRLEGILRSPGATLYVKCTEHCAGLTVKLTHSQSSICSNAALRPLLCIEELICCQLSSYVVFLINLEPLCRGLASTELYLAYDPLERGHSDNRRERPDLTASCQHSLTCCHLHLHKIPYDKSPFA